MRAELCAINGMIAPTQKLAVRFSRESFLLVYMCNREKQNSADFYYCPPTVRIPVRFTHEEQSSEVNRTVIRSNVGLDNTTCVCVCVSSTLSCDIFVSISTFYMECISTRVIFPDNGIRAFERARHATHAKHMQSRVSLPRAQRRCRTP